MAAAARQMMMLQQMGCANSGDTYGDINDTNMEGEETLENIDHASLKIFPASFFLYLLIFWASTLA